MLVQFIASLKIRHVSVEKLCAAWFVINSTVLFLCLSDALVQISIDDLRNILYTRSEKGTIQVGSSLVNVDCHAVVFCVYFSTDVVHCKA